MIRILPRKQTSIAGWSVGLFALLSLHATTTAQELQLANPLDPGIRVAELDVMTSEYLGDGASSQKDAKGGKDPSPPYCPKWTFRADLLFLTCSSGDRTPLAFFNDPVPPPKPGDPALFPFGFSNAGPRLSLISCINEPISHEIVYFGVDGFSSTASVSGNPIHMPITGGVTLPGNGTATYLAGSDIYSIEFNVRRESPAHEWLTWLAGFRWMEFSDRLTSRFTPAGGGATIPILDIDTDNHLFGFQLGAEILAWDFDILNIEFWCKGGVFHNNADQSTTGSTFIPPRTVTANADHTTAVAELGVSATVRLNDTWSLRGGYFAIWLEGVAIAAPQINTTNLGIPQAFALDTSTGIFMDGAFVGLQGEF